MTSVEKEQLAISYAAFVLSGTGAEVNQASLTAVLQAAGVTVSAGLLNAVAKALKGRNVSEFFGSISGGSAPSTSAPVTQAKTETKAPAKQQKKKEAPPAEVEEEGMDMGGLFD